MSTSPAARRWARGPQAAGKRQLVRSLRQAHARFARGRLGRAVHGPLIERGAFRRAPVEHDLVPPVLGELRGDVPVHPRDQLALRVVIVVHDSVRTRDVGVTLAALVGLEVHGTVRHAPVGHRLRPPASPSAAQGNGSDGERAGPAHHAQPVTARLDLRLLDLGSMGALVRCESPSRRLPLPRPDQSESAAVTRVSNTPVMTLSPGLTWTQIRYTPRRGKA